MHKDKNRDLRLVEPDGGIRETYSNHIALCATGSDLRIAFGQLVPIGGNAARVGPREDTKTLPMPSEIEQRVAVTVSWDLAKWMGQTLADAVTRFEAKNGEIKKPITP
jgi:hypothetical protein